MKTSIFSEYYNLPNFIDRYLNDKEKNVDVIIPLKNTNEIWQANLYSYYREIPINRLYIGDGGCNDNTIQIVKTFPRVKIINQTEMKSLGFCIAQLIKQVETKYFIYLHSDVFLPEKWFDNMYKYRNKYDWYECNRKITVLYEYDEIGQNNAERPYSGSQFGKRNAFDDLVNTIDDDFLYRNEDIVIKELIENKGGKYCKVPDTYHYHQLMNKKGDEGPVIHDIIIKKDIDRDWENETLSIQVKGIIKYLQPNKKYLVRSVNRPLAILDYNDAIDWTNFKKWVREINPEWLNYLKRPNKIVKKIKKTFKRLLKRKTDLL